MQRIVLSKEKESSEVDLSDSRMFKHNEKNKDLNRSESDIKPFEIPFTNVIPRFLYQFAWWTGIITIPNNNIYQRNTSVIFCILMYIVFADINFTYFKIKTQVSIIKMLSLYLISCTLPVVSYHVIRRRKKQITVLLQNLEQLSQSLHQRKGDALTIVIIYCMPILFSAAVTSAFILTPMCTKKYTYEYDIKGDTLKIIVLGLKFFFYFLLHPTLNNILAFLYCTLCRRCCELIRDLKGEVMRCPLENFKALKQLDILRQKEKLDSALDDIDRIFSLPSFLIITTNILSCSSILSSLLLEELEFPLYTQRSFYTINIFGCLLMTFWMTGNIPIEMKEFKDAYYKKACLRMLKAGIPEEPRLERWIFDKPDFVLTGCGILSYTRNTLLAVLGALLTYTLLVIDK